MKTFEIKTKVKLGQGSLSYVATFKDKKVFIVTDPFMVKSGMIHKITTHLSPESYEIFSDIVPDPPMGLVVKGVEVLTAFKPDVVIALGGGSAIDATKAIMNFAKKIGQLNHMEFIAIPTTSGTGSEVTSFSVITDEVKQIKYPLVSDEFLPDVAILEPELVKSVPPSIVADTGMDVLTHAIEAYVSTQATDFSDALAEKAVELVFGYLVKSYSASEDMEAKEKMHNASCLAGLAFNLASLGMNHAIAHNIGGKLHIPHGRTNALLLPYVIEFNSEIEGFNPNKYTVAACKYAQLAKLVGIEGSSIRMLVKNFIHAITKMQHEMKMPTSLQECKVSREEINKFKQDIAKGALEDACILTNPRKATTGDIVEIIYKIS
ncbi:alcohol dehydrogenase [Sporanaerobium hydrogeniformans]|uniref:Alcohol dehydrogenase n=1 Tax=Sporanaerobium hydrogeniformans TaxID=3072179 RepID=A0AC61DC80_9FIRM|nr:1-propanol dehydrogenase PduQ [Sporanaerobium hydrogeniformans]PHV70281.1 alcohol dehydrogenase [Sporanaerobium hydrogeniformans]